jgi:hypothetical protein
MRAEDLVGAWQLQEYRMTEADGSVSHPWGPRSAGFLLYTPDGHMSATIEVDDTRAGAMTFQAVCGTYEVAGDSLVHRIALSSNPKLVGTEQKRKVRIENGLYYLTASPSLYGGPGTSVDLIWRRATRAIER